MASKADNISTIITGVLVIIFVAGKIGWDLWQSRSEKDKTKSKPTEENEFDEDIDSLEILTDTYIEIIKKLRGEVERLKEAVEALASLKVENERLQAEVKLLISKNEELIAANLDQEKRIKALTKKVTKLANNGSKKPSPKKR